MQATDNLKKPVRLGALSMAKVVRALLDKPRSVPELMDVSGLSTNTVHEYMRALRKEGVVHIGAWRRDATGRESLRVFKFGPGKDAARAKKSKAQIARECRERKREALQQGQPRSAKANAAAFFWPTSDEEGGAIKIQSAPGKEAPWSVHRLR